MEPRRARASGYPEGGGGVSGPLPRPRDGFLLSQERRWNHVVPAQAGTQRGVECRGLSRVPALDSCFRRKDGGASGGDGAGPLTRPRDAFLLSQKWLRVVSRSHCPVKPPLLSTGALYALRRLVRLRTARYLESPALQQLPYGAYLDLGVVRLPQVGVVEPGADRLRAHIPASAPPG